MPAAPTTPTALVTTKPRELMAAPAIGAVVSDWLASYDAATLDTYRQRIALFAAWLGVDEPQVGSAFLSGGSGSANFTALRYKNDLRDQGLSPSTINGRLTALRSLVTYARIVGIIDWELSVKSEKSRRLRDTRGPGMLALAALYNTVKGDDDKALRDRAIVWLLIGQGLRESEIVSLDLEHLDLDGDRISIRGKGRREREWITIDRHTKAAVSAWVQRKGDGAGALFTNFDPAWGWKRAQTPPQGSLDRRMTRWAVRDLVGHYSAKIGKRIWPHAIRHSAITEIIEATGDVNAARLFARHSSLATTSAYADNLDDMGGRAAAGHADRFATLIE